MVNFSQITGRSRTFRGNSYLARLPDHYYRFLTQLEKPGKRVHDVPQASDLLDYKLADSETRRVERVPDTPLTVVYPTQSEEQIWGGEGVIKGFFKYRTFYGFYRPQLLFPTLFNTVVYSEILDKYMRIILTEGAMMQIDECEGFDNYLLKTPVQDFKSKLALRLRRQLLISLAKKNYYPNDPQKHKFVQDKYKDFVVSLEEAEFSGLTIPEATTKLKIMEAEKKKTIPLKVILAQKLVEDLKEKAASGEIEVKTKEGSSLKESITGLFGKKTSGEGESKTTDR